MNREQLDSFHNDLLVMIEAGVPIQIDDQSRRSNSKQTVRQLLEFQKIAESNLEQLESLTDRSDVCARYWAALQVYAKTNDMASVVDGLAAEGQARQEVFRLLRWPIFYLASLIGIVLIAGYFFYQLWLPGISEFRHESHRIQPTATVQLDYSRWFAVSVWALPLGAVAFLFALMFGVFRRMVMWIGGNQYVRAEQAAAASRSIEKLLSMGIQQQPAICLACQLTGLPPDFLAIHAPTNDSSVDRRYWSNRVDHWSNLAARHRSHIKFVFPSLLLAVFGSVVALMYGLAIYGSILSIFDDLLGQPI